MNIKLSEIFRRAADELPQRHYLGMCDAVWQVFNLANEQECLKPDVDVYEHSKKSRRLADIMMKILDSHRPKGALRQAYWVGVKNRYHQASKNAIWFDTVEEAQAWRKDVLLKCAAIAESEGL